jgi:molybdopterin converting factor small subunit
MAVAIKVRYFASLKENLGRESDSLEVEKAISVIDGIKPRSTAYY